MMPEIAIDSTTLFWILATAVGGVILFLMLYFGSSDD